MRRLSPWSIVMVLVALLAALLLGGLTAVAGVDPATTSAPTALVAYDYDGVPRLPPRMPASSSVPLPAHVATLRSAAARAGLSARAATGFTADTGTRRRGRDRDVWYSRTIGKGVITAIIDVDDMSVAGRSHRVGAFAEIVL